MFYLTLSSLFCGFLLIINHTLNARLATFQGNFFSSMVNHIVGFLFLVPIFLLSHGKVNFNFQPIPWYAYTGGIVGIFFVAIFSLCINRLGILRTTTLVIGSQMIFSSLIDLWLNKIQHLSFQFLGCALIILGLSLKLLLTKKNTV